MQKRIKSILRKAILFIMACFLFHLSCPQPAAAQTEGAVGDARNGIAEVNSGFMDREGTFHKLKSASGFLISNLEGRTYLVTNYSAVYNSNEEKQSYCQANSIAEEDVSSSESVRVIVKGDVAVEAAVLAGSRELDFCILSTNNVVNEKKALRLGDSKLLKSGDAVYALGFPKEGHLEYTAADVEICQGTVQDKSAGKPDREYIWHSAAITEGNAGGPLLDGDGYVVGINGIGYAGGDSNRHGSLPVEELTEVLDNFAIDYDSRKKDELLESEKIVMIIYGLGGLILLCLIRLAWILVMLKKEKKSCTQAEPEEVMEEPVADVVAEPVKQEEADDRSEAALEDEGEKTVGLHSYRRSQLAQPENNRRFLSRTLDLKLIRRKTGEIVTVSSPEYLIGKNPSQVDYAISGNKAISRKHACISWKQNTYFICDIGSANGTCLNGKELTEGIPVKLSNGDTLSFSDEEFDVKVLEL